MFERHQQLARALLPSLNMESKATENEKAAFILKLRHFVKTDGIGVPDEQGHSDYRSAPGESTLIGAIADYLSGPHIPEPTSGINWFRGMPQYLTAAFKEFRSDPRWEPLRAQYAQKTGGDSIPDLIDVHTSSVCQTLVVYSLVRLVPLLASDEPGVQLAWLYSDMRAYFGAQSAVIHQAWQRFVCVAYRGLMRRIKNEVHRYNSGTFGQTQLVTYAIAGRVGFTFSRPNEEITFIADANDPHGHRSRADFTSTPYQRCTDMIDDVVSNWDPDKLVEDMGVSDEDA